MTAHTLTGLVAGDFKERIRRPVYAVILLSAVGLGYLATPARETQWVIMNIGSYRGVYDSAYIGMATALAGALWLTLGGFYVVRDSVGRDQDLGVGELLAVTPMRTVVYFAGKFLGSVLVLASMLGVLIVTALVVQLARGESTAVDPIALVTPFVLIALPMVMLTAAAALIFETVPLLRGGLGNITWFFVWLAIVLVGQAPQAPFGGMGVHAVVMTMRADMAAQGIESDGQEFSLGLTYLDRPLKTFEWSGFDLTADFVLGRLVLVVVAVLMALLPALWFGRFDPARGVAKVSAPSDVPPAADVFAPPPGLARPRTLMGLPRTEVRTTGASARLVAGEVRILLRGVPRWWWLGALAISLAVLVLTSFSGAGLTAASAISVAWIWPILIWSRLGTQRHEHGVETLMAAYPATGRRLLAEWAAGVVLTALVGAAPLVSAVITSGTAAVGTWVAAVLFVPSLALALGVLSRTHRLFQIVYLVLWYVAVNGVSLLDYMGLREDGPSFVLVAVLAAALLGAVFLVGLARRDVRV
ncbi:hypothetical protein [Streptosporangium saharense]|uniref:Uncharacterized protein n=1 Tax=Streptosporangium saharense TaxID=1706840 RepID=A0A7W7VR49_9ACTN|nr:hypothetical protein [Streptosporangium saharense]MBB4918975.1 hypothetical protein [Streptosporangium saharense]